MCGICGDLRFNGVPATVQTMRPMLDKLARRGPDDEGIWVLGSVALGQRRLSIIDLSSAGHQPMLDGELSLVFNGCIYNYPELRQQLEGYGHRFQSHSDTEIILKGYRQWGLDCVQHFEGMFAFAIWDANQQTLFACRDRFGIKPFYYILDDEGLRFASSTQALLASGAVDKSLDPIALHHLMTLHAVVPAPRTLIQSIRKLEPSHWMIVPANGRVEKRRYWSLTAQRPSKAVSEAEMLEATLYHLKNAIQKRMNADVPVGVLLSGGLDSSLIVALLAELGASHIPTYSIGFEDTPEEMGSEFEYSDQVVARYATDHHKILVANVQVLPRLPEAVAQMSEPMVAQDAVAFYLLSEQVSKSIKVVQSGQGADEVFGGYFWYPQMHAAEGEDTLTRFASRYFDRTHEEWLRAVNPRYHVDDVTGDYVRDMLSQAGADTYLDQVLRFDTTTLIVDDPVKRVDNMTMAWGLEARTPFMDHHLIEYAMTLPPEFKLRDEGKYPLKALSRGRLPDAVIDRKKGYFPMPALKFVRGAFYDFMADILNSRAARERGLFNRNYLELLLKEPDKHYTAILGSKLWHAALLELWLQIHVDGV
ncbi:MAG: N-acetylglutaminylglutamine amidotransferase [Gammaproteobacteria bacterium]|nr:N-acetylglutaminylglutamine amidotransferase [Gammaproteobacteria bacterium]